GRWPAWASGSGSRWSPAWARPACSSPAPCCPSKRSAPATARLPRNVPKNARRNAEREDKSSAYGFAFTDWFLRTRSRKRNFRKGIIVSVKIRMKMLGRKHRHFFRIVAIDTRQPRDGRILEELGSYDPMIKN